MPKYSVTVTATYVGSVEVEAANEHDAWRDVKAGLREGAIVTDLEFSEYDEPDAPEEIDDDAE